MSDNICTRCGQTGHRASHCPWPSSVAIAHITRAADQCQTTTDTAAKCGSSCSGASSTACSGCVSGSITFTVPGAPQGKGRPRVGTVSGRARVFTPAKTVAYENLIAHAAQQAMAGRPLIDGPVSCSIAIDAPIPASWSKRKQAAALAGELMPTTRPDLDNVVKAIFDGCNGVLWCDDAQVVDLSVRKRYAATPGVRVTIAAEAAEYCEHRNAELNGVRRASDLSAELGAGG